jgi:hypothetical protein
MSALSDRAGVPESVLAAIREIESGGNPRAMRFETRLFRERTGQTIEGTSRASFERAYAIDPRAAVESTSWGTYQVLGGTGIRRYGSPQDFLAAFSANPEGVSDELVVSYFMRVPAARDAANRGDWHTLARRYNGQSNGPWYRRFVGIVGNPSTISTGAKVLRVAAVLTLGWVGWQFYKSWRQR